MHMRKPQNYTRQNYRSSRAPQPQKTISSDLFNYSGFDRTFTQEISTLEASSPYCSHWSSFWMKSTKTGNCVEFTLLRSLTDNEGDVTGWEYYNDQHKLICTIWND